MGLISTCNLQIIVCNLFFSISTKSGVNCAYSVTVHNILNKVILLFPNSCIYYILYYVLCTYIIYICIYNKYIKHIIILYIINIIYIYIYIYRPSHIIKKKFSKKLLDSAFINLLPKLPITFLFICFLKTNFPRSSP